MKLTVSTALLLLAGQYIELARAGVRIAQAERTTTHRTELSTRCLNNARVDATHGKKLVLIWASRKKREPNQGRPFGSVTRFPGSVVFSREHGVTQSHLFRVLTGERQSRSLVESYATWLRKNKLPWPVAAVVQPTAA